MVRRTQPGSGDPALDHRAAGPGLRNRPGGNRAGTADRLVAFAITDAATGELLGNLALSPAHELSYWVARAARGRGVATRAGRLLLDHAWASGVDRVALHAHVDNLGSQRVAERAGFRPDRVERAARELKGEIWDVVWYGLDRPG
jgi:RimJ/RimL family protein N-acetyltransferase